MRLRLRLRLLTLLRTLTLQQCTAAAASQRGTPAHASDCDDLFELKLFQRAHCAVCAGFEGAFNDCGS
jgi:hypothetical protein